MHTNISNEYFCFPLTFGGELAAEIEGYADLEVDTEDCTIIDMTGIQIITSMGQRVIADDGLEGELKKAIRSFYVDGAGQKLMSRSIDWHEAEAGARDAGGDFRYSDSKNEASNGKTQ